jgi:phosphohistidine swiveling domain-containing protein
MDLPERMTSHAWVKNWSGNWRTAFASLYWLYTTSLEPYIGKNLELNLLVCERESSSNYLAKDDLDAYGSYVAGKVVEHHALAENLAKDTIASAEELFDLLGILKDKRNLDKVHLLELKKRFYTHIPPHFSMKKVIDYLPEDLQKRLSPMLIEARVRTESLFNQVDHALREYAALIAERTGHPQELTEFLTIDEIAAFLDDNKLPSERELMERSHGLAIFCEGERLTLLSGEGYLRLQGFLVGTDKTELKGNTGFRGMARGKARIVFDPSRADPFNEGDILVTGMTRPEFLPLMKKAAAFVTDAGGMLSHAAIVARELKKPCVLATENATKTIKDGDLIEVDANRGTVRILKRA